MTCRRVSPVKAVSDSSSARRVCVVGAGPAGLVATKTLLHAGLDVDCFEMSSTIGGHWVIDNPNGRAAAYRSLRTNTTKAMSRLSDYRMPDGWPEFPGHARVRVWFESYVDHFRFRPVIALRHEVVRATPLTAGGWTIAVRDPEGTVSEHRYDALVAASGNYWVPRMPSYPGVFRGRIIHARDYRDPVTPCDVRRCRVVVVGSGNTGCELVCEIAVAGADKAYLSARSGNWIFPKVVDGRPVADQAPMIHPEDPVPAALRMLPAGWRDRIFVALAERMVAKRFGARMARFERLGLPPAPARPLAKRPAVSQHLLTALETGVVVAKPAIEKLEGDAVVFSGGPDRQRHGLPLALPVSA